MHLAQREKVSLLLSMPRQTVFRSSVQRPAGLPINALPGWDTIPLHSKLPMLKCPDNQVIFSKNKIGRTFETKQQDFDTVCLNSKMDYNPLHDKHLKSFYANEKILKRLRDNGEITQDNDVICTLKEFNEYRIPLHETYISRIGAERIRLSDEKRDQQMVDHAEKIAEKEKKILARSIIGDRGAEEVLQRKEQLNKQRIRRNQVIVARSQKKVQQIQSMKQIRAVALRQKRELHELSIKHRLDVALDIQRKRLIALKKHLQFKSERLKHNMNFVKAKTHDLAQAKARQSWETHLKERKIKHEQVKKVVKQNEYSMKQWIAKHMERYRKKWNKIQAHLETQRSRRPLKIRRKHKRIICKIRRTLEKSDDDSLKNLTSQDIHDALNTAIDLERVEPAQQYDVDDCIYKAARYILEGILAKFKKDLTGIHYVEYVLGNRIRRLFCEVKQYVIKRATQIIVTEGDMHQETKRFSNISGKNKRYSLLKYVSFSSFSALIGNASYALSNGFIKMTAERPPTPTGSMTSVLIEPENEYDTTIRRRRHSFHQLTRDEQIFIEHLFIKFKRQLTVGIGRQVLAAIECHRRNKILAIRKELQEIDKQFLVDIMTRSILSYAVNSCNYHANIILCQHALAADIILNLQKGPLKPLRDPRNIVQPHSRCVCKLAPPFAKYCR